MIYSQKQIEFWWLISSNNVYFPSNIAIWYLIKAIEHVSNISKSRFPQIKIEQNPWPPCVDIEGGQGAGDRS